MTVLHPESETQALINGSNLKNKLQQIEAQLIRHNRFIEALHQLGILASQNLRELSVWLMIGLVYVRMAHWSNAIAALKVASEINSRDLQVKQLLAFAYFNIGQKKEACELIDKVVKSGSANSAQWMLRAYIYAHTVNDPLKTLSVARDWGKRFADPLTRNSNTLIVKDRSVDKKLRIGYVTADFREHSVAFFMLPILQNHNKDQFEVHVFSSGPVDNVTIEIKSHVDHWHDVIEVNDEDLCKIIRSHEIDILVDLSGFTHGHRLLTFARRAAPVQVTWLGYMHTLGMKSMDYRIVDIAIAPHTHQKFYSEDLYHISCMACYAPPAYSPLCEIPPIVRNKYPTFVSLNNSSKVTDEMLEVWRDILIRHEDARLIIMVKEDSADSAQLNMQPRVEAAGMPLERISVMHQQPLNRFMEMGYIADVVLDTAPISGGTTTLHSLWMGMPVVTMDGVRGSDSASARTLEGLGYKNWIAKNRDEYINIALELSRNIEELTLLRSETRKKLKESYLMNYSLITNEVESAFKAMWNKYLIK